MWICWYRNECLVSQLPISTCWVKQEPLFWIQWRTLKEKSISCSTITSIIHLNWPRKCLNKIPTYVVHLEVIVNPTQKRFRKAKLKKEEVESRSRHGDIANEKRREMSWWLATCTHTKCWRCQIEVVRRKWCQTSSKIIMKACQVLMGLIRWYLIMTVWGRQHVGIEKLNCISWTFFSSRRTTWTLHIM